MRGVRAHARSHASRRDSEKKRTAYIILNDIETFSISLKNLGQISFNFLASNMLFVMHEFCWLVFGLLLYICKLLWMTGAMQDRM